MKPQIGAISLIISMMMIIFVPHAEATRVLLEKRVEGTNYNKNILLSSLYNTVHTPTPNPGTESSVTASKMMVMEKNFAGRSRVVHSPPTQTPTTRPSTDEYYSQ
ncbi:hypothetical protein HAX54_004818, partial [Datura stramonium]|nr:hypothetical protein [Datura stramonium]